MGNIFNSLYTGYSGLAANQAGIDVTSHNVANASSEGYTRQRVTIVSSGSISTASGQIGTGATVESVVRIKDEYLFSRYEAASADLYYHSAMEEYLEELSNYFPDLQDTGLNVYLQDYFDAWSDLANNPTDGALKVSLASATETMTNTLNETYNKIDSLGSSINDEIKLAVDEINSIAEKIASLNGQVELVEADGTSYANDLRDERDRLEETLYELIDPDVSKDGTQSLNTIDSSIVGYDEDYRITVGGYPLVDNSTYHPLGIEESSDSKDGYYNIYFEYQDHTLKDITDNITGGEVGALLEMRGTQYDENNEVTNGTFTEFQELLNSFSASLIQYTNSIYAGSAQESAESIYISKQASLSTAQETISLSSPFLDNTLQTDVKDGKMTLSLYDSTGSYLQDVKFDISESDSLTDVRDAANAALAGDGLAYIEDGVLKFSGSGASGEVIVKDDGSNVINALNETQYKSLDKVNGVDLELPLTAGTFEVVVYDDAGEELSRREITVDSGSSDPLYSTLAGIASQMNFSDVDDNGDNSSSNDLDDYYTASFTGGKFVLSKNDSDQTTYIAFDNDTAGFGGSLGFNKFLDGNDASNISLNDTLDDNNSLINAYSEPSSGNNNIANAMLQFQYDDISFTNTDGSTVTSTVSEFYRYITSTISNATLSATESKENAEVLYNTVKTEYDNESAVSTDEEMINLLKYQSGYQANAKVITTIEEMLDILMGIKS